MNDMTTTAAVGAASAQQQPAAGLNSPLGMFDPQILEGAMKAADMLASSSLVPKDFQKQPGNCLIAIQWGAELGLAPLQAMQNIAVINGRPSIWGDALLALVRASGAMESIKEELDDEGAKETWVAHCTVKRRGQDPVTRSFSWDDAKAAQLAGKQGPWQQYPKRMLAMRARSFALRDVFTDVLKGLYVGEEAQDMPREGMRDVTPGENEEPKSSKLQSKLKEQRAKPEGPTVDDVLTEIANATDQKALGKAGEKAGKLSSDEDREKARRAYRERLDALKAEEAGSSAADELKGKVKTALESGAGGDTIRKHYADELEALRDAQPERHAEIDKMIAEAD